MNIVMPALHSTPSYDHHHFNPYPYSSPLFVHQEHFAHAAATFAPSAFSPAAASQQVDPRWLTSSSTYTATAGHQPHNTLIASVPEDFISQSDELLTSATSFAPSSPIPNLSATSRLRPSQRRFHSFSNTPTNRMQRRSTDPSRGATNPRFSSRQTFARPPSQQQQQRHSPPGSFSSYGDSPNSQFGQEDPETRANKRRRTTNDGMNPINLGYHTPDSSAHVMGPTPQLHEHAFGPSQSWAGPPTGSHHHAVLPIAGHHHGLPHHTASGASHWPAVGVQYYTATDPSQHVIHESALVSPHEMVHPPMMASFKSPGNGSPFFASSPVQAAVSPSAVSSSHSHVRKMEPGSPSLNQDASDDGFDHPPTEFPPRPYTGGPNAKSPWAPVRPAGKIFGSRLEQMPAIEKRLAQLEDNLDHYLDVRSAQALRNSQLPGLSFDSPPIQAKSTGPSRIFGGRIWPTALARRVRRTPRD